MKTTIDQTLLKILREDINTALESVAKTHNVTLKAGNASYDPSIGTASFKLNVVALGDGGVQRNMPAELFLAQAHHVGLKPEYLGKEITLQDRQYKIAGYNPKARKNCVIIRDTQDGKTFVITAETVKRHLEVK